MLNNEIQMAAKIYASNAVHTLTFYPKGKCMFLENHKKTPANENKLFYSNHLYLSGI